MSAVELSVELPGGARVRFTTRAEGNLSSTSGPGSEHAEHARERLRAQIGLTALVHGRQVHGSVVERIDAMPPRATERPPPAAADGQATALAGLGTMALVADCLPVALTGPGAVAMIHAGWRGLAAGVLENGVLTLRELAAQDAIHAAIGPAAGACCYEVGPEVQHALGREAHERARIDLRTIARERLLAAGVETVRDVCACTICDPRFFSHRREGPRAGRQAGVAWLA